VDEHRNLKLYDQLLQFPLFQGMSRSEMLQLAGNTRFGFHKMAAGKMVVKDGDECRQLLFLINGCITITSKSDDYSYQMTEWLSAPWLIQPEVLFGTATRYTLTARADSDCHFIILSKDEVMRLLDDFFVFRLNLFNLLSAQCQRHTHSAWRRSPRTLEERIVRFFSDHSLYPAGKKELHIMMEQLAVEVDHTRLNVSRILNDMQQRELIQLSRGRIIIPMLERLFMQ
jgi:CRP-like cAMP-binding protein